MPFPIGIIDDVSLVFSLACISLVCCMFVWPQAQEDESLGLSSSSTQSYRKQILLWIWGTDHGERPLLPAHYVRLHDRSRL